MPSALRVWIPAFAEMTMPVITGNIVAVMPFSARARKIAVARGLRPGLRG